MASSYETREVVDVLSGIYKDRFDAMQNYDQIMIDSEAMFSGDTNNEMYPYNVAKAYSEYIFDRYKGSMLNALKCDYGPYGDTNIGGATRKIYHIFVNHITETSLKQGMLELLCRELESQYYETASTSDNPNPHEINVPSMYTFNAVFNGFNPAVHNCILNIIKYRNSEGFSVGAKDSNGIVELSTIL